MDDEPDYYILIFKTIKGIGPSLLMRIINYFGTCKDAFNASIEEFRKITKNDNILKEIASIQKNGDAVSEKIKEHRIKLKTEQVDFISINSPSYPMILKGIPNPPLYLYKRGNLKLNDLGDAISIVGTRNPSIHGHSKARRIAFDLASEGYTIISGLARGIDLEAHIGALEANGKTIAVLASGVSNIYPKEHEEVANDIIKNGAIISETGIDNKADRYALVDRNRITSGLAKGTLVVEGDIKSGTRHCANSTISQRRKLFFLNPLDPNRVVAKLPLDLKKNMDAIAIESAQDIIQSYSPPVLLEQGERYKIWKIKGERLYKENLIRVYDWKLILRYYTERVFEKFDIRTQFVQSLNEQEKFSFEIYEYECEDFKINVMELLGVKDIEFFLLEDGIYFDRIEVHNRIEIGQSMKRIIHFFEKHFMIYLRRRINRSLDEFIAV
ncbi:MAG: DNA-processing protein DprA [Promethearchaeota archaeon]